MRLRERLVKQLAAEGLQIESEQLNRDQFNEVEVQVKLDGVVWLRAAAKMVLASLSLCVDEAWLDTDDGGLLRGWLWDKEPTFDDGSPGFAYPNQPSNPETLMAPPPTHMITVISTPISDERIVVSVGLFGSLYVRIGVEAPRPLPDKCWVIAPGQRPRELPWQSLVEEAALRYVD